MTFLVDANVLSEPTKPTPDSRVVNWLREHEGDFAVDSTALEHDLTLVTRNIHDFRLAGVTVLDPFL
jgi:predicted nucleic acid-binding protein